MVSSRGFGRPPIDAVQAGMVGVDVCLELLHLKRPLTLECMAETLLARAFREGLKRWVARQFLRRVSNRSLRSHASCCVGSTNDPSTESQNTAESAFTEVSVDTTQSARWSIRKVSVVRFSPKLVHNLVVIHDETRFKSKVVFREVSA